MTSPVFPAVPTQLKPVSHFLKVATEHETRDPVIAYWCRFYAVQKALAIDKSSAEAKTFLFALLDYLERRKKELSTEEAVTNETVAEAHIEDYAFKLFNWADGQDRAEVFNKNVVKAFYTSGILFDLLDNFGPVNEEFMKTKKYAKWKAAYIHNCLKTGEKPEPGPASGGEFEDFSNEVTNTGNIGWTQPQQPQEPPPVQYVPPPQNIVSPQPQVVSNYVQPPTGDHNLSIEQIAKAQKYCKWAGSALNFDDVPTAIQNLTKALRLLQTGQDD